MEHVIFSAEAMGFLTASLVFLIALLCIARGWGNILTTFILLLFSLFAGFTAANQELIRGYFQALYKLHKEFRKRSSVSFIKKCRS